LIGRIEHWALLRPGQHAWVLAPLHPSNTFVKAERPPTPKWVRLFGRHNSSGGATFVAMMQTTDLRERNNLACGGAPRVLIAAMSGPAPRMAITLFRL
jgi:hypothetical protein